MKKLNIYVCLIVEEELNLWHRQFTDSLKQMEHQIFTPPANTGLRKSWLLVQQDYWNNKHQEQLTFKILF